MARLLARLLARVAATRGRVAGWMRTHGFTLTNSVANFLLARPPLIVARDYAAALGQRGILIRYFDLPRVREYVRITVGTDADMDVLVKATEDILMKAGA